MRGSVFLVLASCLAFSAGAAQRVSIPPLFVANHGQAPRTVSFIAKTSGWTAYFSPGEILYRAEEGAIRVQFDGARRVEPQGIGRLAGVANFLTGPKEHWLLEQPLYQGVAYPALYPGIDMSYGPAGQGLKSEFTVAAGADPSTIRMRYTGGQPRIDEDGSMELAAGGRSFREHTPTAYQERGGRRVPVSARFVLSGETVGFSVGAYDSSLPLVIDPAISYSTLLGGSGADAANALAVDPTGAAYLVGFTESIGFPTANPVQHFDAGGADAFVAKLDPSNAQLIYCTYLGGTGDDRAYAIAVDAAGAAYVTGSTQSQNFPVAAPLQAKLAGYENAFVLKLSPAGDSLSYSTYLGGSSSDAGYGIAVDSGGSAYVVGDTISTDFPAAGWQKSNRGGQDVFVAKLAATGGRLAYGTYLGGSNTDHGAAIAVDAMGEAWIAGSTWSADFPVANAFQKSIGGGQDAFVARLDAAGDALPFSSYLGGSGGSPGHPEAAQGIALDWQGNAYLAGVTSSADFPLRNSLQSALGGESDAFITKVNASGALSYSTYLGGSGIDAANAITVDPSGAAYVAGYTYSTDLPVVNAFQSSNAGDCDAFMAEVNAGGTLNFLSYLGGSGSDAATSVAAASGSVYAAGWTLSSNFPLRNAYQSSDADNYGGFLTVVNSGSPPLNQGVAPSSGGGVSQTFRFQFSDPSGVTDLTTASALFHSNPSVASACAIVYNRAANTFSLLTDAGAAPSSSLTPGSGTQSNSECILDGAGSSVTAVGNTLTLNLAITFQPAMAGPVNIYTQSANLSTATSWTLAGTWTVPAMIVSPIGGSWLPGASVTFQWTGMGAFTACSLSVSGIAPGGADIFTGALVSGSSQLVTNLPLDGRYIYVRIGSSMGSEWWYVDYVYAAAMPVPAALLSPVTGSTLPGATVTFQWSTGAGISQYWLYASKVAPGGGDLDSLNAGSLNTATLTNLPTDGCRVYVRLGSLLPSGWMYADYVFSAAGLSVAAIVAPVNGSVLTSSTVSFQWSAGSGVSQYWLYVSNSAPGASDIYSGTQGSNTSKTLTGLPTDGSIIYVRLWSQIGGSWEFQDYSYQCAGMLTRIAPVDDASLAAYLAATPFYGFDFSQFPSWDLVTPPTSNQLGDGTLNLAFSSPMLRFTTVDPENWGWSVAPYSERANGTVALPILDPYNSFFNPQAAWNPATNWFGFQTLSITLSRPVWTFGFEAEPDDAGTITATFYAGSSGSLPIDISNMSDPNSRIFAATGAPITKVVIALTNADYPDFAIGAFRYGLSEVAAPAAAQGSTSTLSPGPAAAAMLKPANGSTLPGATATFQWSAGVGVSEYWLYVSKVAPGGKDFYSGSQGSKTSATFTSLPSGGGALFVRLWSEIGGAWQYADYSYKTAANP